MKLLFNTNMKAVFALLLTIGQLTCFAQTKIGTDFDKVSPADISNADYSEYTLKDFIGAFEKALKMKTDSVNKSSIAKGNVLLSVLAKQVHNGIIEKKINPNSKITIQLLQQFREHKYYIYQPEVSKIIKFFGYICMGEYTHIYEIIITNKFTLPMAITFVVFFCFILFHLAGKVKWKYKRPINKIIIGLFVFFFIFGIRLKATCECNVSEYSFYGIPIN